LLQKLHWFRVAKQIEVPQGGTSDLKCTPTALSDNKMIPTEMIPNALSDHKTALARLHFSELCTKAMEQFVTQSSLVCDTA